MKKIPLILIAMFSFFSSSLFAQQPNKEVTDTIKVWGECGMCKNRIQKTLKVDGVSAATWDIEKKILVVTYDAAVISNEEIQKKVAAVGHDTEKFFAPDAAYKALHGCCKYDRKPKN
jgi:periplasmic mercuric ion binding protein